MKRLSIRIISLTAVMALSCAAFSKTSDAAPARHWVEYYFYSYPDDTYNDYNDTDDEETEMWIWWDAPVDQNPSGGTLVERGYANNNYPHNQFPSVYLYAHFDFPAAK